MQPQLLPGRGLQCAGVVPDAQDLTAVSLTGMNQERRVLTMLVRDKDLGLSGWGMFPFPDFPAWKSRGDPTRGLDNMQGLISALRHLLFCFPP